MVIIEYRDKEIRPGFKILDPFNGDALTVERVIWRLGRGLELFTRRDDGYMGPVIYPHPDEPIRVIHAPALGDEPWREFNTNDYPYAEVMR